MRRWAPLSFVVSTVLALAPAAQASRVIKGNVPGGAAAAPTPLGRSGMAVVVDSPLPLEAPSLGLGSGLPVSGPHITEADKPGLKARVYAREVQGRESAGAAAKFLEDDETRGWLREKAPKRHRELFKKASGLNDLRLTLQTYEDPDSLRLALMARSTLEQAKTPYAMMTWIDSDPSLAMYRNRVAAAFWEWETLDEQQRGVLTQNNVTPEQWARVSMDTRRRVLRSVGRRMLSGSGVGRVPKTAEQVQRQQEALHVAWGSFDNDERYEWNQKFSKGVAAYQKLEAARQSLSGVLQPGLLEAFQNAEAETDPDKALHFLKTVFDGVGEKKQSRHIETIASARPDQSFTDAHRQALGQFMKKHLLAEIAGTQAGDMLAAFYAKQPLKVTVGQLKGARFAQYDPKANSIDFSETMVTEFLRGRGQTLAELFQDAKALRDLTGLLAPSFVHEATHQTQFQALVDLGVPPGTQHWYDTTFEVEAFTRQTLYTHEKARASERHRLLFIEGQNLLGATRSDVKRAQLLRDNPSAFRNHVLGAYTQVKSLSGMAHDRLLQRDQDIQAGRDARRIIGAELARRSRLPRGERQAREKDGLDLREWNDAGSTPVDKIKTSALRGAMRYRDEDQSWVYDVYDYLRNRYATTIRGVMTRLKELYPSVVAGRIAPAHAAASAGTGRS